MLSEITAGVSKTRKELFIKQETAIDTNIVLLPLNLTVAILSVVAIENGHSPSTTLAELVAKYKHLL